MIELSSGSIATGSYDKTVCVWNLDSQNPLDTIQTTGRVFCLLEFEPGILLCGTDNNEIEMWDINGATDEKKFTFKKHLLWVNCLTKCNNNFFASGSNDSDIIVWNYERREPYKILSDHEEGVLSLITLKDGRLCSGSSDMTIKIWDIEVGECVATLKGHTRWVKCVYQLLNGYIISGSDDKTIRIWDQNSCLATLSDHKKSVRILCQISDNLFASGSFDKTIKIWDINTKQCVQTLEGHTSNVICLLLHSSGLLISSSGDRNVKIWKNQ